MSARKPSKAARVISWVLLLLALVTCIGLIAKFGWSATEQFQLFSVSVNGERILSQQSQRMFAQDSEYRFDVGYTPKLKTTEFGVHVTPSDVDFDFRVEGYDQPFSYQAVPELTEYFDLQMGDSSFVLRIPRGQSLKSVLQSVLQSVYGGAVTIDEALPSPYCFRLLITSYDGSVTYRIDFGVQELSLKFDKSEVIF